MTHLVDATDTSEMILPALITAFILSAEPSAEGEFERKTQEHRFELGLRAGGLIAAGEPISSGLEFIHLAPGYRTPRGVVSAFYSRQLDTNPCEPKTLDDASERTITTVTNCDATNQRAGLYFRFMPFFGEGENWFGFGAAWYQRQAKGKATINIRRFADDNEEFATREYSGISRREEGVSPFLLMGGNLYTFNDLSVGAEGQVGADLNYHLTYNGRTFVGSPRLSAEVGLRLTYAAF